MQLTQRTSLIKAYLEPCESTHGCKSSRLQQVFRQEAGVVQGQWMALVDKLDTTSLACVEWQQIMPLPSPILHTQTHTFTAIAMAIAGFFPLWFGFYAYRIRRKTRRKKERKIKGIADIFFLNRISEGEFLYSIERERERQKERERQRWGRLLRSFNGASL